MDDFLIIGGGIAGLSAGARLAALGRVTLLEAETALGYHASGRSAALYEGRLGQGPVMELTAAGIAYFEAEGLLSARGMMFIAKAGEEAALDADIAEMGVEEVGLDEARRLLPVLDPAKVTRAAYHEAAWDIDTDRLLQGFARSLRTNGRIVTGARVSTLRRTATGWEAEAGGETYEGRTLVNAAGAWADSIAALAGIASPGFTPKRRSMARVAAPEGHDPKLWPMTLGAGESFYMKPDAGALLISPADAEPMPPQDAWAEDAVLAEGIARWEDRVTTPVTRMIANWAGLRTFAPDGLPVIGPAPADPAFLWCAGQGGVGMQTSPAASALLADLVAGRSGSLAPATRAAFSPARFG